MSLILLVLVLLVFFFFLFFIIVVFCFSLHVYTGKDKLCIKQTKTTISFFCCDLSSDTFISRGSVIDKNLIAAALVVGDVTSSVSCARQEANEILRDFVLSPSHYEGHLFVGADAPPSKLCRAPDKSMTLIITLEGGTIQPKGGVKQQDQEACMWQNNLALSFERNYRMDMTSLKRDYTA